MNSQSLTKQTAQLREFCATHPYKTLALANGSWRYLVVGSGRQAVVLFPGALVGAEMWFYVITALQDRYRCLAPDLPNQTLSLATVNAALLSLLEAENIEQARVVGYSAGGGLAQTFVQAHPERVTQLVLSHCTPISAGAAQRLQRVSGLVRLLPLFLIRAIFKARSSRYPATAEWAAFTRAFFAERLATLDKATFMQFLQSGAEAARTFQFDPAALQHWPGQILLLSSQDDSPTFKRLGELQARYPTAQTHVFEQGGHHTVLLFPEIYTAALARFLAGPG